jgi:RND family efflux transporter MFP subunit
MADAQFTVAEAMRRRMTDLLARGSATAKNVEDAEAGYQVAAAAVAQARANVAAADVMLGYADVRSPIAGWVVERRIEAGDMASPGMPLFVVEDLSKAKVVVQVPESDVLGLAVGVQAIVSVPVLAVEVAGTIARLVPAGDPESRTYEVQIVLVNPDGALRSGMFARARFDRGAREAVVVPTSAIVRRGQLDGVFVLDSDGRARTRWIRTRAIPGDPARMEVTSGLGVGERFLLAPPAALADGGRVKEA